MYNNELAKALNDYNVRKLFDLIKPINQALNTKDFVSHMLYQYLQKFNPPTRQQIIDFINMIMKIARDNGGAVSSLEQAINIIDQSQKVQIIATVELYRDHIVTPETDQAIFEKVAEANPIDYHIKYPTYMTMLNNPNVNYNIASRAVLGVRHNPMDFGLAADSSRGLENFNALLILQDPKKLKDRLLETANKHKHLQLNEDNSYLCINLIVEEYEKLLTAAVNTDLDLRDIRVLEGLFGEAIKKVKENEMINKEVIFTRGVNEAIGDIKVMIGRYNNGLSGIRCEAKSSYAINRKKYNSGAFCHLMNTKNILPSQAVKDAQNNGYHNTSVNNNNLEVDQNSLYALNLQKRSDKAELGLFGAVKTSNFKGYLFTRLCNCLSRKSAMNRACSDSILWHHRWDFISEAVDKQRPQFTPPTAPENRTETPENGSLTQQSKKSKRLNNAAREVYEKFGGIVGASTIGYQPLMEHDDERQALVPVSGPVQRF